MTDHVKHVLAHDFEDYSEVVMQMHAAGWPKSIFTQITDVKSCVSIAPGSPFYITKAAPHRDNYREVCEHLRALGCVPASAHPTPAQVKVVREEHRKKSIQLKNDLVWSMVEAGVNPSEILIEEHHTYNQEEHKMDVEMRAMTIKMREQ